MGREIIKIENLSFTYPRMEEPLLRDINLEIRAGEFVILTGPNGSGKTSLGKCLNGLIPYSTGGVFEGSVEVCGFDTLHEDVSKLALYVGFVFPNPEDQLVTPHVEKEVAFGLSNLGIPREAIYERVDEVLDRLHIAQLKHSATFDLSTGEQQIVAIASCLVMEPEVLILDDPLSHLNQNTSSQVIDIVKDLNSKGGTIVWISQNLSDVFELANRIVLLDGGQIVFDGSPHTMAQDLDLGESAVTVPQYLEVTHALVRNGFSRRLVETSLDGTVDRLKRLMAQMDPIPGKGETEFSFPDKRTEPTIRFDQVTFCYPNKVLALRAINLEFHVGDFVLLSGWNGSGKTTLGKHINGLLRPSEGAVYIAGEDISDKPTSELAMDVGFLFQNPDHQLHKPTVKEELAFSLKNFGVSEEKINEKVSDISEKLGLNPLLNRSPQELSGSEKKKVTVASVLIHGPKIVILDEATANLDRDQSQSIIEAVESYFDEDKILISISHDVRMWASSDFLNRIIIMRDGAIVSEGTPEEVLCDAEIMGYLYGDLLPVTRIAHSLADKGVRPTHYKTHTLVQELKGLGRRASNGFAR